jgi:hypothetical protein
MRTSARLDRPLAATLRLFSVLCLLSSVRAQEALWNAQTAEDLAAARRRQLENYTYSLKTGDLRLRVQPWLSAEWNDNVNLSATSPESDFIFTPSVKLDALYPIGEANVLNLFVDLGYRFYVENSYLDQLLITPGTALSFDLFVKDFRFNFHERFSYQLDPTMVGAVSGTSKFGGLYNTVGVLGTWNTKRDLTFDLGYDFQTYMPSESTDNYLNRDTHLFLARGGWRVHPTLTVGLEGTASPTFYSQSYLNDNVAYSAGAYAQWQPTEHLRVLPRGGYTLYTFTPNNTLGAVPNYDGYYFGLQLHHRVSQMVSYMVSADHRIQLGTYANLNAGWYINLGATWSFIRDWPLTTTFRYENAEEGVNLTVEKYQLVGFDIGVRRQIMQKVTAGLTYGFLERFSNWPSREYTQNRVTLTLTYTF